MIKAVPADEVSVSVHLLSVFPSEIPTFQALQSGGNGAQLLKKQHPAATGDLVFLLGILLGCFMQYWRLTVWTGAPLTHNPDPAQSGVVWTHILMLCYLMLWVALVVGPKLSFLGTHK